MATGPGYPQGSNTFVPADISGRLRIGFSRNAKLFNFPKYVQYVEAPNNNGYYLKITSQEAARVINVQDFQWPDGAPDRNADTGTESFNFQPFLTQRNSYKFRLGDLATRQAVWPIVEQHGAIKAAQLMTARTVRGLTVATTAGNWAASTDPDNLSVNHTDTATNVAGTVGGFAAGGKFDVGTGVLPYLKRGLGYVADIINQDTLGVVDSDPDSFFVIMNPTTARQLAQSAEVHAYIANSYWAADELKSGSHPNGKYGLPSKLYGFNIVVENAVRVTSKKGATRASSYAMPVSQLLVCSRPGGIDGIYGAPSFSTLSMFWYQDEMTVETHHEDWDRLTLGRVVENTQEILTCPASGYLITAATG